MKTIEIKKINPHLLFSIQSLSPFIKWIIYSLSFFSFIFVLYPLIAIWFTQSISKVSSPILYMQYHSFFQLAMGCYFLLGVSYFTHYKTYALIERVSLIIGFSSLNLFFFISVFYFNEWRIWFSWFKGDSIFLFRNILDIFYILFILYFILNWTLVLFYWKRDKISREKESKENQRVKDKFALIDKKYKSTAYIIILLLNLKLQILWGMKIYMMSNYALVWSGLPIFFLLSSAYVGFLLIFCFSLFYKSTIGMFHIFSHHYIKKATIFYLAFSWVWLLTYVANFSFFLDSWATMVSTLSVNQILLFSLIVLLSFLSPQVFWIKSIQNSPLIIVVFLLFSIIGLWLEGYLWINQFNLFYYSKELNSSFFKEILLFLGSLSLFITFTLKISQYISVFSKEKENIL